MSMTGLLLGYFGSFVFLFLSGAVYAAWNDVEPPKIAKKPFGLRKVCLYLFWPVFLPGALVKAGVVLERNGCAGKIAADMGKESVK